MSFEFSEVHKILTKEKVNRVGGVWHQAEGEATGARGGQPILVWDSKDPVLVAW